MTADDIIRELDRCRDRAELVALLAPLRLPANLDEFDRGRLSTAVVEAASRFGNGGPHKESRDETQHPRRCCALPQKEAKSIRSL
jgi:hypothetical protein